jgi:hypothetical protein
MTIYDDHFNSNEWFILIGLFIGCLIIFLLPKRFPKRLSILFFTCGVYSGFFFDHSLSVQPVSFYNVNDKSTYQFFDFLSYVSFGPVSYMYFYFYDKLKPASPPLYIFIWAIIYLAIEGLSDIFGVYHYQHGYKIYYSFIIYLIVNSFWIGFYKRFHETKSSKSQAGDSI